MKRLLLAATVGVMVLVMAAPVGAGDVATYEVSMDGAQEVPGPGDPDGTADMTVVLGIVSNEVCVNAFSTTSIEETAAHIHAGAAGVAGPVVVDLTPAIGGTPYCTPVSADLMEELVTRPECYYVSVGTEEFPDGAVRGQLVAGTCQDTVTTPTTATATTATTAAPAAAAAGRPRFTG